MFLNIIHKFAATFLSKDVIKMLLTKPRATRCVFSHANIETTSSKGVHCSFSDA